MPKFDMPDRGHFLFAFWSCRRSFAPRRRRPHDKGRTGAASDRLPTKLVLMRLLRFPPPRPNGLHVQPEYRIACGAAGGIARAA